MIGEIALAIAMGADAVDIGKTLHPHPTLGEPIGVPNLEKQGGAALTNYITGKGYLDFTAAGKALGVGVIFG